MKYRDAKTATLLRRIVREIVKERGEPTGKVADKLGVERGCFYRLLNGERSMEVNRFDGLLRKLGWKIEIVPIRRRKRGQS